MRPQLLRKNYSRDLSLIRIGPLSLFAFRYVVVALGLQGKNPAISPISRVFGVVVAVIICSCTLFFETMSTFYQ